MPHREYCEQRYNELANFPVWVLRSDPDCPKEHQSLDGLALSRDHPFWAQHRLPMSATCFCYILGARSDRGVRRLGGDPDKPIPPGW